MASDSFDGEARALRAGPVSGVLYVGGVPLTVKRFKADVSASQTDAELVASVAGKALRVLSVALVCGATATVATFTTKPAGAGSAISMQFQNAANGGVILPRNEDGWMQTNSAEGLALTTGGGSTTGVMGTYVEVSA